MAKRTEHDVTTGESKEVDLTPEEEAELVTRSAAAQARRAERAARKAAMTVEEKLAAVGLTVADIKAAVARPSPPGGGGPGG